MCCETAECFRHPRASKGKATRDSRGAEEARKGAARVDSHEHGEGGAFGGQPGVREAARRAESHLREAGGRDQRSGFRSKCGMTP